MAASACTLPPPQLFATARGRRRNCSDAISDAVLQKGLQPS
jgi:hypothetical protein